MNDDIVYTLRDFRAKTKEAFDYTEDDVDIVIERNGKRFVLITESFYKELLKPSAEMAAIPEATIENVIKQAQPDFKVCRHGAYPMYCKFAKNGKSCK
jgi:PHD/YefM family antitoxin component YafN of YafNO toxin-antitoxin module